MTSHQKITRELVAKRLANNVDKEICGTSTPLSLIAKGYAWTEPLNMCNTLGSSEFVFACKNEGYFSFEASFSVDSEMDVVDIGQPRRGKFLVRAPIGDEEYDFNHNFVPLKSNSSNRKADCIVDWQITLVSSGLSGGTGQTLLSVSTDK